MATPCPEIHHAEALADRAAPVSRHEQLCLASVREPFFVAEVGVVAGGVRHA